MIQVKVSYYWPPIPTKIRYKAVPVDYDPGDPIGYGATIQESLADFEESYELKYDEEPKYKWS